MARAAYERRGGQGGRSAILSSRREHIVLPGMLHRYAAADRTETCVADVKCVRSQVDGKGELLRNVDFFTMLRVIIPQAEGGPDLP